MYIQKLQLLNFKNYEVAELDFEARINVLVGKNGSGKTNLLDAIYYLSLTKSAFAASDSHCLLHGQSSFMVKGVFSNAETHELLAAFQNGQKKTFREDQLDYAKLSDHIGKYPIVMIAPDDVDLVKEGSEARRKFFDGILSQLDKQYLNQLIQYNQALKQRNSLLRMFQNGSAIDWLAVESYDQILIKTGHSIFQQRKHFTQEFLPVFQRYFNFIVEDGESTSLSYTSEVSEIDFEEGLKKNRPKDVALQRTNFGIHRDDYVFMLGNGGLRRLGSQGQQKSFVIALKLAQFEIMEKHKGIKPILLLDDIFDKLDDFRIARLLELIKQDLGQLFITDARPDRTKGLLDQIHIVGSIFHVENGKVNRL